MRIENALLREHLDAWPLVSTDAPRVLEIGCGGGRWLALLSEILPPTASLIGVDLVPERLLAARARRPDAALLGACGSALPFPANSIDLVVLATVSSGIQSPALRAALAAEVRRTLRPQGRLLHYDLLRGGIRDRGWSPISPAETAVLFDLPLLRSRRFGLPPRLTRGLGVLGPAALKALARRTPLPTHGLALLGHPDEDRPS